MTVNELIQNVGQLSISEFEAFFNKIQALRVQKLPNGMNARENKILEKINTPFSRKKQLRFNYLIAKRDTVSLSADEFQELLDLTVAFEKNELRRLKLLAKLADLKKLSLPEVVDFYHIRPLANG